jgi:hypothetical protein
MKLLTFLLMVLFLIISPQTNAQWTNPDLGLTGRAIQCFAIMDSTVLAGTDGGLVRSTNNGTSWTNTGGGLPYTNIRALLKLAPNTYPFDLLAGMINGKISQSSNSGNSWTGFPVDSVQMPGLAYVNSIFKVENNSDFWVGTDRGVYLLPQYYPLSTWIPYSNGMASGEYTKVRVIIKKDGDIWAGTDSGVYELNGSTWVQKNNGLTLTNVTALKGIDGYLFAGTRQGSAEGVYVSADSGQSWTLSKPIPGITCMLTIGSNLFVGSFGDGVWLTKNYGTTWNQVNDGFGSSAYYVLSLDYNPQYLFAGTGASSIWRRPLSQLITWTNVGNEMSLMPQAISLEQNYPNPFNPSTTIQFELPSASYVALKIFTLLGEEVVTLINEKRDAGQHSVQWNAHDLASGVYFYRLSAGTFTRTKKFLLIR